MNKLFWILLCLLNTCLIQSMGSEMRVAASEGNSQIVKRLIEAGAHINDKSGIIPSTPLHSAVFKKSIETIQVLLDHRADLDALDCYNRTPLYLASENESPDIVRMLLENKASVYAKTGMQLAMYGHLSNGLKGSPLHGAIDTDNYHASILQKYLDESPPSTKEKHAKSCEIVKLLLDAGIDFEALNNKEESAYQIAARENNKDMMQLIKNRTEQRAALIKQLAQELPLIKDLWLIIIDYLAV